MRKLSYCFILLSVVGCNQAGFNSGGGNDKKTPAPAPTAASNDVKSATPTPSNMTTDVSISANPDNDLSTAGANAVTQGSFTAWTVPASPKAFEDYKIIVRVTLPSNTTSYGLNDLSGMIHGSDQYTQSLMESRSTTLFGDLLSHMPQFKQDGGYAYIGVMVPGAKYKVQDQISISSRLLNETQSLTIVFN